MTPADNFLSVILEAKRRRVAEASRARPLAAVRAEALDVRAGRERHALSARLGRAGLNVIAEIKRASPSKGELRSGLDAGEVALAYERAGAAAISVLTEEDYFRGSLADLQGVRAAVALPILRKDFVFDEWQIYESAAEGADAVLLIVAGLEDEALARLRRLAEEELGLDALVEVHTGEELRRAGGAGARLIGVNNRNLRTFEVSLETSVELAAQAPAGAMLVSESGLRTRDDLSRLKSAGYAGFLIGETFMRAEDPGAALRALLVADE